MFDIEMNEYEHEQYQRFVKYVKSTWGSLLDTDWINEPVIDKVIINNFKNTFKVCVYLKENEYYDIKDGELVTVKYNGDNAIVTEYSLSNDILLYALLRGELLKEFGLDKEGIDVVIYDYVDGIPVDESLTKRLERYEEDYAYTLYCIEHDL